VTSADVRLSVGAKQLKSKSEETNQGLESSLCRDSEIFTRN
jgi:hypothetical protein